MSYDIVIGRQKKDLQKFGLDGTIYLGKHYVTMGQTVALSNKVYMDMIRSHVVFVCGKRGGGKCVLGDTLVTLENGSRAMIKDLEKDKRQVACLDKKLKIKLREKSGFYKRKVNEILHVRLRSGKELKLTPEHPLLTIKGWKEASLISQGERIATPRVLPFFGNKKVPNHTVKILAYLIAEGNLTQRKIGFTNTDPEINADLSKSVKAFDSNLELKEIGENNFLIVGNGKNSLSKYLKELGLKGKNAYTKFTPELIFTATKENIAIYLNRLFSCDGSIHYDKNKKSWRISYGSASKRLIEDVSSLLLRFGILSRTRQKLVKGSKNFYSYELEIFAQHIPKYIENIGFIGKKEILSAKAYLETKKINRNPNVDTIPKEIWDEYRPSNWAQIGRAAGYKHPKAMRERIRYSPSRQILEQVALADQNEAILNISKSDIFWDEIARVEKRKGTFEVYDISVDETHNFVANDVIIHNSYTMGVIAEGMASMPDTIRNNLSIVMLDTMGIYWTMKYPNQKEKELLDKWELDAKALNITIFTPTGFYKRAIKEGIPTDREFSIKPTELLGSDWVTTFGIIENSAPAVLIERIIHDLRETEQEYSIRDILKEIEKNPDADATTKAGVKNHFIAAEGWGLFSTEGTPLSELAAPGQVTVLDLSAYSTEEHGWAIKSLVTGIVSQKLFLQRMQARKEEEFHQVEQDTNYLSVSYDAETQKMPLVWLVIDEAHEFLPNQGNTLATDPLVTILREGRQPGISLILASQQPGKIHTDVMTQSDIIISHRITAKLDTDALGMLMQSYMRTGLDKALDGLPRVSGAALVLDDNNEKMFPLQVRPRFTWHGGESPTALKEEKKLFDF